MAFYGMPTCLDSIMTMLNEIYSAIDARVVYTDNTIIYTDNAASSVAGTYSRMSVIDIYEYVGDMARTDLGWVSTGNLL